MTDTPTTHKEMTLPESVTLYKVDIPNVGTMLTFAEPINPDCTFIMGEYTRHPKPMVQAEATLREDGGGAMCYSKPDMSLANIEYLISRLDMLYNNVAQTVRDHYAMDMQKIRNVLVSLEAALKNPSDAGGECDLCDNKGHIEDPLNSAMGGKWFRYCDCAHGDKAEAEDKPAPPQADTPIKGAGEEVMRREIIDEINTDAGNSFWDSVNGPKPKREDVSGEEMEAAQREDVSGDLKKLGMMIPAADGGTFENDPPDAIIDAAIRFMTAITTPAPIDADKVIKWFESVVKTNPCVSGNEPEIEAIRAALKKGG